MRIRNLHINWRPILYMCTLVLTLSGIVVLMGAIQVRSSEQACSAMTIILKGEDSFIEQKDIDKRIVDQYGTLIGRTMETLPIHAIENDLKSIPYVKDATVNMDMNGQLTVSVEQRKAVLRIVNDLGNGFYLDETGLKMPISLNYVPNVPVASGNIKENLVKVLDSIQTGLVKDIFKIAQYVGRDSVWNYHITQLYVNANQEIELVPRIGNQKIVIGNGQQLDRKFEKLLVFYESIVPRVGLDTYKSVHLNYEGQLVCERNQGLPADTVRQWLTLGREGIN